MTTNSTARFAALAVAAILCLPCSGLLAADPAPSPSTTLAPAVQEAFKAFTSDDFKSRQDGSAKLQIALAQQLQTLVNADDPEVLSSLDGILQFNDGLTRWIINTLKLPAEQRKAEIAFGLKPEIVPTLGLTFSNEPLKRAEGIRALAKIDDPQATAILANFLNDPDRAVYLAAMEAVWDKKPTDAVVNALWDRAVGDAAPSKKAPADIPFTFRDQPVGGPGSASGFANRKLDGNIAVEVLDNLKAPSVPAKIITFLQNFDKATDPNNAPDPAQEKPKTAGVSGNGLVPINGVNGMFYVVLVYNPVGEPVRNVFKLAQDYNSKDTYPILYKLATNPLRQKNQGREANKTPFFSSNRTPALVTLIFATGQKAEDYKLRQLSGNGPWFFVDINDETAAMKKLRDWYAANVDKNVPDIATDALDKAASQPAPGVAPAPKQ